jgi:hypothetical protein
MGNCLWRAGRTRWRCDRLDDSRHFREEFEAHIEAAGERKASGCAFRW